MGQIGLKAEANLFGCKFNILRPLIYVPQSNIVGDLKSMTYVSDLAWLSL